MQALEAGDISVALLFSTDPAITAQHLVVLSDDRGLQPVENVVPLLRRGLLARYGPRLVAVLNAVLSAPFDSVPPRSRHPGGAAWACPAAPGRELAARPGARPDGERGTTSRQTGAVTSPDVAASLRRAPPCCQLRAGAAPPAPPRPCRRAFSFSTTAWLILGAVALAGAFLASQHTPWLRIDDRANTWVLRLLAGIRTPWLTGVANGINRAGSGWGATALGLSVVALTMAFRRWRHLLVFLGSVLFLEIAGTSIYFGLSRPRPYGVTIIGSWGGYSGASPRQRS